MESERDEGRERLLLAMGKCKRDRFDTDQHENEEGKMKEHICIRCGPIADNSLRMVHQVPRLVRKKVVDLVVCIQLQLAM